jgi:hypothetical protein
VNTREQPRADRAAVDLAEYVARIVAQAPPLTTAQKDRIALLLRETAA